MGEGPRFSILIVAILLIFPALCHAQLKSLRTPNLRAVYYEQGASYLVPYLARCFENSLQFHRDLFDYTPSEEVTVFMQDFRDIGYGGAETIPWNSIEIGIEPFNYTYETVTANERLSWMMNHEMAHIVAMDKASGRDAFFRSLFLGKVYPTTANPLSMVYSYLTNPRRFSPRWYLEGIAVFLETWMAGGLGRALGSYDEMVFRAMVLDSSYFYDVIGLESEGTVRDFQVGANSYLYGTRFMSYLAYQYGPEKLIDWVNRSKGSKPYFASQFRQVYGQSLDDEWSAWISFEQRWQQANLDSIRLNPTTRYRPIARRALGSLSRTFYDAETGKLYAAVRYPGRVAHIAAIDIDSGKIEKICDVKGAALYYVSSLAYDPQRQQLFYTTDNNGWRDLNVVDIKTGKFRLLIKDVRAGDLAFNRADSSLWGVRHYLGLSTLVRIPYPYDDWQQIHTWPYGTDLFDLDISPDGTLLTGALIAISGKQRLIKMSIDRLQAGEVSPEEIFDFDTSSPANFVFSPDGRWLIGSSYYSGVSNIFRYDFETEEMVSLTNAETGFFRPALISEDSLVVLRYSGAGFVPVMIANTVQEQVSAIRFLGQAVVEKHPVVKSWLAGSPASIEIDSLTISTGDYKPLASMKLNSIYPIVEGYKDFAAVGLRFNFLDRIGAAGLDATASYTPSPNVSDDERFHAGINLHYWTWKFSATYNGANFYDLFGPTKTSRKGYSLAVQHTRNLLFDEPRSLNLTLRAAGYGNLETLPDFQNVAATYDKLLTFRAGLHYQHLRKSLGAIEDEKGIAWGLNVRGNYVNEELFPQAHAELDYGILLPLRHSSIWLRAAAGQALGNRNNPFANFYFGGFGNNWVDFGSSQRYREFYSFPGAELNAIGGRNFAKTQIEWTLPPLRFRRFGMQNLYLRWARASLFSTAIRTNFDSEANAREVLGFGGQLDFRLVLFSSLNSTFSIGYGVAVEDNRSPQKELMISLKIL